MDNAKLMELMKQKRQAMRRHERATGFKPGKQRIRILPGWRAAEPHIWFHDFGQHFVKDAADQIQAVYLCTDATFAKPCVVCSTLRAAIKDCTDDATAEILSKAAVGKVTLVNALHLDGENPNTPVVTAIKSKLFTQLMNMLEENGPEAFFDLDGGHEIIVTRDGKGLNTTYNGQMSIKVGTPIPAAVMSQLVNLDEYVQQESDEQERKAIAAINGVAGILPAPHSHTPSTTASSLALPGTAPIGARAGATVAATDLALDSELDDLLGDVPELQ